MLSAPACVQTEDGGFEPILPAADLEAIHARILAEELALKEDNGAAEQSTQQQQRGGGGPPLNIRLAAALGLTPLLLPFRCALAPPCFRTPTRSRLAHHPRWFLGLMWKFLARAAAEQPVWG